MVQHRALRTGDGSHHAAVELREDDDLADDEQIPLFEEIAETLPPAQTPLPQITNKKHKDEDVFDKLIKESSIAANGKIPEKIFENNNKIMRISNGKSGKL